MKTVEIIHHVETDFFSVSRSRVSIETTSRQIQTPKLNYFINIIFIFSESPRFFTKFLQNKFFSANKMLFISVFKWRVRDYRILTICDLYDSYLRGKLLLSLSNSIFIFYLKNEFAKCFWDYCFYFMNL